MNRNVALGDKISTMKRLVSGVKPTGNIHIGNYFGAMKQFVDLQDSYETFIFVADYHALNQIHDPKELNENILEVAKAYLAVGLDPVKTTIFRQSDISSHTELCWILNSLTPMGTLKRAHAYKDAEAKELPVNMGLFDYPVLMAADILLYDTDVVPIGKDQKQHLEMTQELARIFNHTYGDTFKIPQEYVLKDVETVKGLDGQKMSKSYKNTIGLFDPREVITKKVMAIVTDSKRPEEPKDPETCNVFYYHKIFSVDSIKELETRYKEGKISYKESKDILVDNMDKYLVPFRLKKQELDENRNYVLDVLSKGRDKAAIISGKKLDEAKEKIGLVLN